MFLPGPPGDPLLAQKTGEVSPLPSAAKVGYVTAGAQAEYLGEIQLKNQWEFN